MIFEIVILAMIAAFLGLRLYSVLGQRAEHEEKSLPQSFDSGIDTGQTPAFPERPVNHSANNVPAAFEGVMGAVERGIRQISSADRNFDLSAFLEGAKGAYRMILEAFWKGDKASLRELCDEDVYESFVAAIEEREAAGHSLDNRLVRIEDSRIHSAELDGREARISVLFVADIAAVTRDSDGNVIAGSLDDAIESRDVWTFARHVDSPSPDWKLVATDEG